MQSTCYKGFVYKAAVVLALLFALLIGALAQEQETSPENLKDLSLEQLGNVEVTTKAKAPEQVWKTAAAVPLLANWIFTEPSAPSREATSLSLPRFSSAGNSFCS